MRAVHSVVAAPIFMGMDQSCDLRHGGDSEKTTCICILVQCDTSVSCIECMYLFCVLHSYVEPVYLLAPLEVGRANNTYFRI